ncbi:MAG: type III-B CRISPR-associated protein Cas10/Cmr2 [Leptolyngbya sp. SIO4C1]|nr:type III-B CRISPR-associated protein Cas10/Cmr2 [Leptolyngbya sp. SIO4C1]
MSQQTTQSSIKAAIAWCLAWGDGIEPNHPIEQLQEFRQAILQGDPVTSASLNLILSQTETLLSSSEDGFQLPQTRADLEKLIADHSELYKAKIGLVYGGVTKVKGYVFESADLQEIRGASGLLDRINLIDLPAFFGAEQAEHLPQFRQCQEATDYCQQIVRQNWLDQKEAFQGLSKALIPELIIYSTGGNILAFCPVAFVDNLADAIEQRYAEETLTANSCAVGRSFRLLETRLGVLTEPLSSMRWLDWYQENKASPIVKQILGLSIDATPNESEIKALFEQQKSFNELVRQLTIDFEQRRSGAISSCRSSRRYPPIFETHPYLRRDEGEHRSAILRATSSSEQAEAALPGEPWISEPDARKRLMGQITKRELNGKLPSWWTESCLEWPSVVHGSQYQQNVHESWVRRFEDYLESNGGERASAYYPTSRLKSDVQEARSLREIADCFAAKPDAQTGRLVREPNSPSGSGYVAFIYADGNNMGGYIRRKIQTPQQYQSFSRDIFEATTEAVYQALYQHLKPRRYKPGPDSSRKKKEEIWIYPFEIVAVGGDDVLLIVPADNALEVASAVGKVFEARLKDKYSTAETYTPEDVHRYRSAQMPTGKQQCELSMSAGVLITAQNTPFYYAEDLTNQLMKSAKKRAKALRKKQYYGGTVDFLVMKAVTMISSNVSEFRKQGLTRAQIGQPTLKQYAAPYTLYELDALLNTAQVLKAAQFPRSQLYQIRSLLERDKQTAILNYRYFRLRLKSKAAQAQLEAIFEDGWCQPKDPNNKGNLAPWMSYKARDPVDKTQKRTAYETLWRELVDLYPFVEALQETSDVTTPIETRQ